MKKATKSARPYVPLILVLLLAFSLRLYRLDSQSLWWDELKTIERAILPLPDFLADFINIRNQLPLYFLLMRGWVKLGTLPFPVRLFSVMWGTLGVTAVFQLGRQIASSRVGLTAAFLLAISPFHVWYSQEARMYSFLLTLLVLAHVALIAILQGKSRRYWGLYFVMMATAVFTHYFTFLIVLAHTIFFILHLRPLKPITLRWLGLMTVLALLFIPWIYLIANSGSYSQAVPPWINKLQWYDLLLTLWTFSIGPALNHITPVGVLGLLIFVGGLLGSFRLMRTQTNQPSVINRLLLLWLLLPPLLIYLLSLAGEFSLYVDRYLIIVLPVYLLLVAWGWVLLARHCTHWLLGLNVVAAAVSIPSLANLYANPIYARNDWQGTFGNIFCHLAARRRYRWHARCPATA